MASKTVGSFRVAAQQADTRSPRRLMRDGRNRPGERRTGEGEEQPAPDHFSAA